MLQVRNKASSKSSTP